MNRKLVLLTLLLVMSAFVLAACQPAAPAAPAEPAPEEAAPVVEPEEEKIFIGMIQHSSIPFTGQMKAGFDAACEDLPIECEYNAPPDIDPETTIGMFESMVQKGADAIILNAAPPDAWTTVVTEAVDKGIIVNSMDNHPDPATGFGVFVAPSEEPTAYALAVEFFDQLKARGITSGQIVWGICAPGYPGQELRADGWERACNEQSDFECVGRLDTGHSVELSYAFWETAILQYPEAVGFGGNCAFDGPNLAKVKVAQNADFGIATFDLEPETLEGIQAGVIDVAMGVNPWLNAYLATQMAYEHLVSGTPVPQGSIDSGTELVTGNNVEEFLAREKDLDLKHQFHLEIIAQNFTDLDSLVVPFK